MADYVRETHRLPTVRISLKIIPSGGRVRFHCYDGSEPLATEELSADEIGIPRDLEIESLRKASFELPASVRRRVADVMREVLSGESNHPVWLQIDRSSGFLAIVPWERLLQKDLRTPILRIPNFAVDPRFIQGPAQIAICASSPRAKTPFSVADYTECLIASMDETLPPGSTVHVFADAEAFEHLRSSASAQFGSTVQIHDPRDSELFGEGRVGRSLRPGSARLGSPWLRWVATALSPFGVDLVHFICPGYSREDRGALALARSPLRNEDSRWSHFVGVDELRAFLRHIGAWATAFSPPHDNVWTMGIRLLAEQLAWARPGPILLHDTGLRGMEHVAAAYAFLFGHADRHVPASEAITLYAHPKRLPLFADGEALFEAGRANPMAQEVLLEEGLTTEVRIRDLSYSNSVAAAEPQWRLSAQRSLDELLMRLSEQHGADRKGAAEAARRLKDIFDLGGDR